MVEQIYKLENIEVYREALLLTKEIFALCRNTQLKRELWLENQIKRSSSSVAVNIAEGYGRRTKADFGQFLSISLGSCNETMAFLDIIKVSYPSVQTIELRERYNILGKRIFMFRKKILQ